MSSHVYNYNMPLKGSVRFYFSHVLNKSQKITPFQSSPVNLFWLYKSSAIIFPFGCAKWKEMPLKRSRCEANSSPNQVTGHLVDVKRLTQ